MSTVDLSSVKIPAHGDRGHSHGHGHSHDHQGHIHEAHDHDYLPARPATPGFSLLGLSVWQRLGSAFALIALLWLAVLWALA